MLLKDPINKTIITACLNLFNKQFENSIKRDWLKLANPLSSKLTIKNYLTVFTSTNAPVALNSTAYFVKFASISTKYPFKLSPTLCS